MKRYYFVLFDDGLTLKTSKLAFICFLYSNSSFVVRTVGYVHIIVSVRGGGCLFRHSLIIVNIIMIEI